MKVITNIIRNKNNKNRLSIFVDENYFFSVSENILKKNNIIVGMEIKDLDVDKINFEDNISKAKEYALNLLSYRSRSCYEINDKLIKKKFNNDVVSHVINDLKNIKLLDDYEFAKILTTHNLRYKKLGPLSARNELFKKGIDQSIINLIISETYDNQMKQKIIKEIFDKKNRTNTKMDKKKLNKIINFIRRKGFNWEDIKPVVINYLEV